MADHIWHVSITVAEDDDRRTRADAILELKAERFHGWGRAKRSAEDPNVPVVGEELAAARALSDSSHQLLQPPRARSRDGRAIGAAPLTQRPAGNSEDTGRHAQPRS